MASPKHLEHAILGFLNYQPWTGYELKQVFDVSIRHFWPADQSQIYKALAKLADEGYATVEIVHQDDRPSRKVYSITDKGREEIQAWVARKPEADDFREPFLIQVFFSGMLSDEEAIHVLESKIEEWNAALDHLDAERESSLSADGKGARPRDQFFWFLTVDCGLWHVQAAVDWAEETIDRIRRKEYADGPSVLLPPRRRRDPKVYQ